MGNKYADKEDHQNEGDVIIYTSEKTDKPTDPGTLYVSESKPWSSAKLAKPGTLILNFTRSETGESWVRELFLKRSRGARIRVPKHLVSLDEKYLRRCLELMHTNALKGSSSCALSVNPHSSDMGFIPEYVTISSSSLESSKHAFDHPMLVGPEGLDTSPLGEGIVGSIMGGNSMTNILRSPLFHRVSDHESTLGATSLFENKRCVPPTNYQGSPGRFSLSPSRNSRKKIAYGSDSVVKQSPISMSSSGPSSSSDSRGMLQCTWEGGIPCFALSLDDQKGLYIAKVEIDANKGVEEYVYSFHAESDLVGKMRVSTSFSVCPNDAKVVERRFVLVGGSENHAWETMHSSSTLGGNNKQSTRKLSKVMDVFKGHSGHSLKQRNHSLFCGYPVNFPADNDSDFTDSLNHRRAAKLTEVDFAPNLELAAIVVKDHDTQQEKAEKKEEVGGWGLKFLKKAEIKQKINSSVCSECCASMDIIVPSGHHGGPITKEGGPSSLIDRWRSGGQCDCGGWDVGCPIKVLKARPRGEEGGWSSSEESSPGDCKSFDVLTEGSKQGSSALKMVNVREDLYFISFRPSFMSPLQCFAIAVAIIHSRSPSLGPKHVH